MTALAAGHRPASTAGARRQRNSCAATARRSAWPSRKSARSTRMPACRAAGVRDNYSPVRTGRRSTSGARIWMLPSPMEPWFSRASDASPSTAKTCSAWTFWGYPIRFAFNYFDLALHDIWLAHPTHHACRLEGRLPACLASDDQGQSSSGLTRHGGSPHQSKDARQLQNAAAVRRPPTSRPEPR